MNKRQRKKQATRARKEHLAILMRPELPVLTFNLTFNGVPIPVLAADAAWTQTPWREEGLADEVLRKLRDP